MGEQSHAPGWRGRPQRRGPIVGIDDAPTPLERAILWGCATAGAFTLAVAGFVWLVDWLAGHLHV
jgi:hypothetical protein